MNAGDTLSREGASRLARQIEAYWAAQGVPVTVTIEAEKQTGRSEVWCVRSGLVNGLPVGFAANRLTQMPQDRRKASGIG